jgi:hypothetical protein
VAWATHGPRVEAEEENFAWSSRVGRVADALRGPSDAITAINIRNEFKKWPEGVAGDAD